MNGNFVTYLATARVNYSLELLIVSIPMFGYIISRGVSL